MLQEVFKYMLANWALLLKLTWEHLEITGVAILFSIIVAVPLGIILTHFKLGSRVVIGIIGVLQTIPSMALLALMIPFLGIGFKPAVTALFLYSLLPIVSNTYLGVKAVTPDLIEAAKGMGMNKFQILTKVQIPISMSVIVGGIRTATIICVGTATLGALIGSGGLGSIIYRGLQCLNNVYIIVGALLSAVLALLLDLLLYSFEIMIKPRGLKAK